VAQTNLPEKEITITAYLISDVTVRNAEVFQTYRSRAAEALQNTAGAISPTAEKFRRWRALGNPRNIIIVEFRSMEQARAWYQSPEYASALEVRDVTLERNLILVDGYRDLAGTPLS
jgi:uncharacterized protein (DUF1330 family)